MMAVVAIAATALVSCQPKDTKFYTGTVPAADGPGITYELTINNLKDGRGSYQLDMTYIEAENGKDKKFSSDGELNIIEGTEKSKAEVVYQLIRKNSIDTIYFAVVAPETLRLLNNKMEAPELTGLNYDLVLVK